MSGSDIDSTPRRPPMLRVEVGQHTAKITCLDIDRDGRVLVTGSADKTARIWSVPEGRLLRVIRVPLVPGDGGQVSAVAMSPDGRTVAVGSYVSYMRYVDLADVAGLSGEPLPFEAPWFSEEYLQVFDSATGRPIRHLPLVEGALGLRRVGNLAFSADGRYLAAAGTGGICVWQTREWQEVFRDQYEGTCYGIAFDGAARLATASDDGVLRMYEASDHGARFRPVSRASAPETFRPHGVAFSPDGGRLAVGFRDVSVVASISVADLSDVSWLEAPTGDPSGLPFVTWSNDGRFLYAGGTHTEDGMRLILRWRMARTTRPRALRSPRNTVFGLKPFGEAGVSFGAADPCFGGFDGTGKEVFRSGPQTFIMRGKLGDAFTVAPDGKSVGFGLENGEETVRFDLHRRQVRSNAPIDDTFAPARIVDSELEITDWAHTHEPRLNESQLPLGEGERSRSLAIAPDGTRFVLGADWRLRLFDRDGSLKWEQPTPSAAWGVNIPRDAELVVVAYGDGTVRWHRLSDGLEILSLFVHPDDLRWVAWTQQGYYDASAGADGLIGWHVERGEGDMPDFLPAWHFRQRFCRPEVIAGVLDTLDVAEAVRRANLATGREAQPADLREEPTLPSLQLLFPLDGDVFKQHEVVLQYLVHHLQHPAGAEIRALINGRAEEWSASEASAARRMSSQGQMTVWLPPQNISLSVEARVGTIAVQSEAIRLHWGGRAPKRKPTLFILAIGVSKYKACRPLQFAHQDAEDFVAVMRMQQGRLYGRVVPRILSNEGATLTKTIARLQWLAKQAKDSADLTLLFLAGHGLTNENNAYHFLPHDVDLADRWDTSVSERMLITFLGRIKKGKCVVFIDTCHAGATTGLGAVRSSGATEFAPTTPRVDVDRFANELARGIGVAVITSSTGTEESVEDKRWNNGAFTEAILEGLLGRADYEKNDVITLNGLNFYIGGRVRALTGNRQRPMSAGQWVDFPIARVRG